MNANHFINKIVRKIKCSVAKKKEIRKELLMEIELRQEQGETLESIISQMGNVKEIAESFNENISLKEKRKYVLKKVLSIVFLIAFILLLALVALYKMVPKSADIEKSEYFNKQVVEDTVKETIILLDDKEYGILQDTWIFAHHYCGKLWYVSGIISLIITAIVMVSVMGQAENVVGTIGGVLCGMQMIPLIGSIIPTEKALKRTFDKNGNRR